MHQKKYRFEALLKTLCSQMLMGAVGSVILGIYGVYIFWHEQYSFQLLTWLTFLIMSSLINYFYAVSTKGCAGSKALSALNKFALLGFIAGIIWSIPALWVASGIPEVIAPGYGTIFIIIAVMGMATSAMGSTSAYLPMYYTSVTPFVAALILACFIADIPGLPLIDVAIVLLLFVLAIFWFSYNINLSLVKAIDLRHHNLLLAENYRQEKENAEEANRQKSHFLAAASHDLRQPLQSLILFNEVLKHQLNDDKCQGTLEKINQSVAALSSLFNALLDISRLDAGDVIPHKQAFYLKNLLNKLLDSFQEQLKAKNIKLTCVDTKLATETDPVLLQRCLSNLISNAITHSNCSKILVGVRRCDHQIDIVIVDNGCGIVEQEQDNVFKEFHQLNNSERDRQKGLGLGLAIVKRTTTLLDHGLRLKSTENRGTGFYITVPRVLGNKQSENENQVVKSGQWHLNGETILVIDDERDILAAMVTLLKQWGANVVIASDVDDINNLIKADLYPDAIISDYRLPGELTGAQLIERFRIARTSDIPAMLITGDTEPDRIKEARKSGLLLMHKPIKPARLRIALTKILSGH